MTRNLAYVLLLGAVLAGCTNTEGTFNDFGTTSDAKFLEAGSACTDPAADEDGDGIPNGEEGCLTGRDTDHDKIPDWQDFDSDNDGIPDKIEAGQKDKDGNCAGAKAGKNKWPCDSDGDGFPDYIDVDSDNDGLLDKDEDASGDGLLGCCLVTCGKPDAKWQEKNCVLTADGCGNGQTCENNKCTPTIGFGCSSGETDPKRKDTFGDGKLDNERGTFICRDATEDKPQGRKVVQLRKSAVVKDAVTGKETGGDWNVALEASAKYSELTVQDAASKEAAGVIDHDAANAEVAGFVISKESTKGVQEELADIIAALNKRVPGGAGTITSRASGIEGHSHDKYDTIQGTILDVNLSGSSNISTIRNEIIGTVLGKTMAQLGNLPGPYGMSGNEFVIRFVTVKRFEFQRDPQTKKLILDSKGNTLDTGDTTKWRLLVIGAVASRTYYQDPTRVTGFIMDDLSNGTALAVSSDKLGDSCDVGMISSLPVADIIWIIDESGSMDEDRQNIVNNANNFFSRALSSGLDFRMGVTGVNDPGNSSNKPLIGKFCSQISTNTSDDGGTDRFLLPSEQAIFSSCINNPPGYEMGSEYGLINGDEAVKKHLPRAANDPAKIRPEAKLVLIVATDEVPNETYDAPASLTYSDYSCYSGSACKCQLDAAKQAGLNQLLKPYLDLLSGITDPEAAAMYHAIAGVCNNSCGADVAHGYRELAQALGGQIGDVCQKDLGNTLQVIIDSIVGAASPVKLDYVPISASLAVAMDGVEVQRSRNNGFDYRSSSNSLAFINVKYKKGSEVIASYKRWEGQVILE
jgi:hypothetical protein